ncbi:MAG: AAA family ATPase [archaeon]
MNNPFRYGTIVTGEDFADREKEQDQLQKDLMSRQHILLYSPRRYGKSSLMVMVLKKLNEQGVMTSMIDLFACVSIDDIIEKLVEETVIPAYKTSSKIMNFFKSAFRGVGVDLTLKPDGSIKVGLKKEIKSSGVKETLKQVLDAPEKLATAKKKPLVIVFDEFQEISNFSDYNLENLMRTRFQHHKNVTYVFMGSKKHIMQQMFENADRPFYKFAKPFPLDVIPKKEFKKYILEKFKGTKIDIDSSIVDKLLDFTQGHPYFTQQLCHELWNLTGEEKKVHGDDIEKAIANLLEIHNDLFLMMWDSSTLLQRKMLSALSTEGQVASIYSVSFIERHGLKSASHAQRAIDQLLVNGTVEKKADYFITSDIFFNEWIKRRTLCNS